MVNVPEQRFDTLVAADDFSISRPMRVHVIHNPETLNPLPRWVFNGPKDKQIVIDGDRWSACLKVRVSYAASRCATFGDSGPFPHQLAGVFPY